MLQTRKLTDTRERFPFLRSIVEIVEISDVQRKAKTLLNYVFIVPLFLYNYFVLIILFTDTNALTHSHILIIVFQFAKIRKLFDILYLPFFLGLNPMGFLGVALVSRS